LAFKDGIAYVFRHRDAFDAVARLGNQFGTQLLQGGHLAFELGFGGALVFLFEFCGLEAAGASVGIWHDLRVRRIAIL
jgi:hypothetical protein